MEISESDRTRIAAAVTAAEATTDAEVATIAARQSDAYHDVGLHWAVLGMFLVLAIQAATPGHFVPVLDRALRVVACSSEWARAYGLSARSAALNQPLGALLEVSRETTAAIIEALNGRTAHIGLWFYSGEDSRQIRRSCAVIPWQCGTDAAGGVMMVIGAGEASYASLEIADRTLGRSTRGLLQMLETIKAA